MILKREWIEEDINKLHELEPDEFVPPILNRPEHERFAERIRKTLYYGRLPSEDRPSLPMTEMAVNYIRDAAPKELGKIDMYFASEVGRKAYVSPCSMMLGMIYIERLKHKNPEYLDQVSSSDLFLISMMVASKYLYDEGIDEEVYNDEWAASADIATEDVNQIEREFLRAIDWSLFTQPEDFERLLCSMEERIALTQGLERGYWTYSDVLVHLRNKRFVGSLRQVLHELCKVVLVCSVAYTAGVVTMVASMTTLSLLRSHRVETTVAINSGVNVVAVNENNSSDAITEAADRTDLLDVKLDEDSVASGYAHSYQGNDDVNITDDQFHDVSKFTHSQFADEPHVIGHEYFTSMTPGLTLPGLLTLTLIKDTLTQFIVALKNGSERDENSVRAGCTMENPICRCPRCPQKIKRGKQRNQSFRVPVPPYSVWSSLKYVGTCRRNCARSTSNASRQVHGRGQGHTKSFGLDEYQDDWNEDPDVPCDEWLSGCPVSSKMSFGWDHVPRRLEQHIAVDVGTRFHTAAYVLS